MCASCVWGVKMWKNEAPRGADTGQKWHFEGRKTAQHTTLIQGGEREETKQK